MVSLNFSPPVIAHRGASAYAPENTLIAFLKAAQLGIKWIEFDVMQASCGEPIIFHDDSLERTTDATGQVCQLPYTYLQTIDAGRWFDPQFAGERIPNLQQIIELLQNTKLNANVEIKSLPAYEEPLIKTVLAQLTPYMKTKQSTILFSSFSINALTLLRKQSPDALLGLLLHDWEPGWEEVVNSLQCVSVHVNQHILTKSIAKKIKSMDKALLCYTVNHPKRALKLFSWGVDAVFSDAPDLIVEGVDST